MAAITTRVAEDVGTLVIDNPERRNAMTVEMYQAVPAAVNALVHEHGVRCIVVRGAGADAFGAGSDVAEFPRRRLHDGGVSYESAEHAAWHALASSPVPVLAAVHGACMGGGVAVAVHCDVRYAADDAVFAVPPARLGLAYPPAAVARLADLVGPGTAKRLLFTAATLDAHEAAAVGLVDVVVAKGELDDLVTAEARRIARLAPLSVAAAKLAVDTHLGYRDDRGELAALVRRCYDSDDLREGIAAFLEKRRPRFAGR